jgi:sulfatase maturation enzyme AslB (radical SAM superfamily)
LSKSQILNYEEIKNNFKIAGACLSLTNRCNMKCRYCFAHPGESDMDLNTAIAAVMWLKEH